MFTIQKDEGILISIFQVQKKKKKPKKKKRYRTKGQD